MKTSNVVVELRRLAQSEGFHVLADAADLLEQVRPWLVWSVDSPGPQWQLNQLLARFDADTHETLASRDAFERYQQEYGAPLHRHPRNSDMYDNHGTAMAWAAWQRAFPTNSKETV